MIYAIIKHNLGCTITENNAHKRHIIYILYNYYRPHNIICNKHQYNIDDKILKCINIF